MRRAAAAIVVCAAGFAVLAGLGARADYITWDEGRSLHHGLAFPSPGIDTGFNTRLPCTVPHSIPVRIAAAVKGAPAIEVGPQGYRVIAPWALPWARAGSIALGIALVLALGFAGRALAGDRAGVAAAMLAALEPNLLAHFHYVTSDGPATLAMLLLVLATLRLARTRAPRDAALAGAALGLALLAKHMLVVLAGVGVVAIAVHARLRPATPVWTARRALGCGALAGLAALLVVALGFLGRGLPGRLPENPQSRRLARIAALVGRAPLPVPQDYIDGLDKTASDDESGLTFGNLYLLGELQEGEARRGFRSYYLVCFGLKLPLPLLVLTLGAWLRRGRLGADGALVRTFALGYLAFLSLVSRTHIGIRHALPIVPLLVLEAGPFLAAAVREPGTLRTLGRGLVVWAAASLVSFAPDWLPYTNELITDRRRAFRALGDSNLDWGQAEHALIDWLARERAAGRPVAFAPPVPTSGRVAVSVNSLLGITVPPERYAWLRSFEPVAHVRHAYLVFHVPPLPPRLERAPPPK